MLHTLRFFSSKCRLFHNATFFGSVLFTFSIQSVLKFKCNIRVPKGQFTIFSQCPYIPKPYSPFHSKGVTFYIRPFTHLFSFLNNSIFNVCKSSYCTWSQWWGCHLSLWTGWLSVGVSSSSLWIFPFSTSQWCWFWSIVGVLFPQYPPYLVSLPLSAPWGGARWETSNSTRDS